MKQIGRRETLTRVGVGVASIVALAGCVTTGGGAGDEGGESASTDTTASGSSESSPAADSHRDSDTEMTETRSETERQTQLSVVDTTLDDQPVCQEPVVTLDTNSLTVVGCVRGSNGCHEPVIKRTTVEDSTVELVVESVDTSSEKTACTSVITENGYRVTIRTAGPPAKAITVVHDDMTGQRTVATAER